MNNVEVRWETGCQGGFTLYWTGDLVLVVLCWVFRTACSFSTRQGTEESGKREDFDHIGRCSNCTHGQCSSFGTLRVAGAA